ncbi:MAG: peptidoglycan D,D-transpeptidase FtsI family protein [Candidatus Pristimantibacillus sp.]
MEEETEKSGIANRKSFNLRLNLFFFAVLIIFTLLVGRLTILQLVDGPTLKTRGSQIGTRDVQIPPIRGNILDSTGQLLAYSKSTQSLYFTIEPGVGNEEFKDLASNLQSVFEERGAQKNPMTVEDILESMDLSFRKNTISVPRRIKTDLTQKEIAVFLENRNSFKGIEVVEESIRSYDKDTIAVQLIGYLKKYKGSLSLDKYAESSNNNKTNQYLPEEEVGFDGLEYLYQEELRGQNGYKSFPINAAGRIIGSMEIINPKQGNDLYLTINKNVQLKSEQAIIDHLQKIRTSTNTQERAENAKTGYAVAMEVKTGKVISMASIPDYDPNVWSGGSISSEDWEDNQYYMSNGAIREVQPPYKDDNERMKHPSSLVYLGSTQKPLSVLIGLNEKLFTTQTTYYDTGSFFYGREGSTRRRIGNSGGKSFQNLDPAKAIEKSSNPFMAEMIGNALYKKYEGTKGVEVWDSYVKQFGLGVITESGLKGESEGDRNYFYEAESASAQSALIFASFGQQGRYTALQLAQYMTTLASRGLRMKPQFVEEIRDPNGVTVQTFKPEILNEVDFPDQYWNEVLSGMKSGVQGFENFTYPFIRKTGTSQQSVAGKIVDNAVFISAAPADDPVLAVAVIVPEGGFGGWGAAPIARKIFDAYDEAIGFKQ